MPEYPKHLQAKLKKLPDLPGVYIYKNSTGQIIYVGKAINLNKRVHQYFQRDDALGPKTTTLVSQIANIETRVVESEIQALLLEASLIKKHQPKYNSQLTDNKSYIYICLTKEKYPRIFATHKSKLNQQDEFYGPFPDGGSVRQLLKTIRKIFPYRSCRVLPKKPCIYHQLGLCTAPCVTPAGYGQYVGKIRRFLRGNITWLMLDLKQKMKQASINHQFEEALVHRNQLEALTYITSGWRSLSAMFKTIELADDQTSQATNQLLTTLQPYFPQLSKLERIECFDISNFGNNYFVGSMTVFSEGKVNSSDYKQFKIYTKQDQDDMYMLKEVVWRRLKHPEWGTPDLIVLDGGIPQLSVVSSLNIKNIALVGLAKKQETIVIQSGGKFIEINLPKDSQAIFLLQRLRDEAHRFANRYRKKLMEKTTFSQIAE